MNDTTMVRKLAGVIAGEFCKKMRKDGKEYWTVKGYVEEIGDPTSWKLQLVRAIHEPDEKDSPVWTPDDYRYAYAFEALSRIAEQEFAGLDRLKYQTEHDYDLYTWLQSHGFRPGYVDEVLESERSLYDRRYRRTTLEDLVGKGQIREKNEVLGIVLWFLRDLDPVVMLGEDACLECGDDASGGEGWDSLCGNCADRRERWKELMRGA